MASGSGNSIGAVEEEVGRVVDVGAVVVVDDLDRVVGALGDVGVDTPVV